MESPAYEESRHWSPEGEDPDKGSLVIKTRFNLPEDQSSGGNTLRQRNQQQPQTQHNTSAQFIPPPGGRGEQQQQQQNPRPVKNAQLTLHLAGRGRHNNNRLGRSGLGSIQEGVVGVPESVGETGSCVEEDGKAKIGAIPISPGKPRNFRRNSNILELQMQASKRQKACYFDDEARQIDFVLVYERPADEEGDDAERGGGGDKGEKASKEGLQEAEDVDENEELLGKREKTPSVLKVESMFRRTILSNVLHCYKLK